MAATVRRLPACDCKYYEQGRCLLEERRNPGYQRSWRCSVLGGWETAYDDFLDRAEAFHLGPGDVSRLWGDRFKRLVDKASECSDYAPGGQENGTGCIHEFEALCLRKIPPCMGMCRHYERRGRV